ncbi:MAG: AI-2E family transporter [Eubacteriales bacterium]|nr:AI-2E family transporter [Eubacteriales bacterium]
MAQEPKKKTTEDSAYKSESSDGVMPVNSSAEKSSFKTLRDYKAIFLLIVACLLVMAFIWYYRDIVSVLNYYLGRLSAVIYGLFIAYLLNPIMKYFQSKLEKRYSASKNEKTRKRAHIKAKRWSIAISITIGILIIAILMMLIIPQVLKSIIALGSEAPSLITKVTEKLNKWNADRSWAGSFQKYIDTALDSIETWITETLVPKASLAVISITSAAWSVLMFIVNFLIGMVIAVYALNEKRRFVSWGKKLSFAFCKPETANLLIDTARHGNKVFGEYLIGSLIDSAIVGIICFIFNIIAGIPYPLLIATIIGITNVIPFFGPFIGGVPSGFIILLIDPVKALVFIIFIVILNQIEGNIIAPRILGNVTGISEFWVTFALLFFGAMFGVFGLIMGVPILAVISYVFTRLTDKHMKKKKLIQDAGYYLEVDKYDTESREFLMIDHEKFDHENLSKVKPRNEKIAGLWNSFIRIFKKRK